MIYANQYLIKFEEIPEKEDIFSAYKKLTKSGFGLYIWLLEKNLTAKTLFLSSKEVEKDLGFCPKTYDNAISDLKKNNYLIFVKKINKNFEYIFNGKNLNIEIENIVSIGGIYCIREKETNQILYVGETTRSFEKRKQEHLRGLSIGEKYPYREMKQDGFSVENIYFSIVEDFSINPIQEKEIFKLENKIAKELAPKYGFHPFNNKL